jgi:hypothetical protein
MGVVEEARRGQRRMGMIINQAEGDRLKVRGENLRRWLVK